MKYAKPALSLSEQVSQLRARGLVIDDDAVAIHALTHLNYYRLRGYWLPMEEASTEGSHRFKVGANFSHVLEAHRFDHTLRSLLMEAISAIEVSVRTQFAYQIACEYGSHAYLQQIHFSDPLIHANCLDKLQEEIDRSHETFIKHYLEKYDDPRLPPIWAVCEVMSLGALSKWYSNLADRSDRKRIADTYGMDELILVSFLRHLTTVRNHCAHHGRLWNRGFTVTMRIPKNRPNPAVRAFVNEPAASRKIFNTITMVAHFMDVIEPDSGWLNRVCDAIRNAPSVEVGMMGFPGDWRQRPLWRAGVKSCS